MSMIFLGFLFLKSSLKIFFFSFQTDKNKPQIQPKKVINVEQLEQKLSDFELPITHNNSTTPDSSQTKNESSIVTNNENSKNESVKNNKSKGNKNKHKEDIALKNNKNKSKNSGKDKSNKNKSKKKDSKKIDAQKDQQERYSKQFTHVQFSFDDYNNLEDLNEQKRAAGEHVEHLSSIPSQEQVNLERTNSQQQELAVINDVNGNYDELPLIQISDDDVHPRVGNPNSFALNRSSESIPFIDDDGNIERRSPRQQNYHETRIITLIPKNLEQHKLVSACNQMQSFIPVYKTTPRYEPQLQQIKAIHIMPRIEEQGGNGNGLHNFQYYYNPGYKICQICHLYLHVCPAIKCFECEFTCHQECFDKVSDLFY